MHLQLLDILLVQFVLNQVLSPSVVLVEMKINVDLFDYLALAQLYYPVDPVDMQMDYPMHCHSITVSVDHLTMVMVHENVVYKLEVIHVMMAF